MTRLGVAVVAACALVACGGRGSRGGGGTSDAPLTEEEKEAAKVEAELSPDNHDVPQDVVPDTFQGQQLYEVLLELEGESYAGFGAPVLCFRLHPDGEVSDAYLQKDDEYVRIVSATWQGQSSGEGSEAISTLTIEGQSSDGQSLDLNMSNIKIATKTVNGRQTVYTGTVSSGLCTLGGRLWVNFFTGGTVCRMTYFTTGN